MGLIAACDIAVAAENARFSLSEVKLGLIPATISPYVIRAIGERAARRYLLSAERFPASEAQRLGLVHEVVPDEQLEIRGRRLAEALLAGGPWALQAAKKLISDVAWRPLDDGLAEETARRIAELRGGEEAREGIAAFLEKRKPSWRKD